MSLQSAILYDRLRATCTIWIAEHSDIDCRELSDQDSLLFDDALTHLMQMCVRITGTCKHFDADDHFMVCNDCGTELEEWEGM